MLSPSQLRWRSSCRFGRRAAWVSGNSGATVNRAVLLAEPGRAEEAESRFRTAVDAGHSNAMVKLSILG
ncbi:hypothetical protein [Streptomyces anulatus]|uniref:hypothetical protein n=1 Tax=Streptomyces anulatus TaxID=1892 RepID=UPI003F4A22B0